MVYFHTEFDIYEMLYLSLIIVSWYFDPSHPQKITPGLETNVSLTPTDIGH